MKLLMLDGDCEAFVESLADELKVDVETTIMAGLVLLMESIEDEETRKTLSALLHETF